MDAASTAATDSGSATPSQALAAFAATVTYEDLPAAVLTRARLHILDGLGLALASRRHDFAAALLAGLDDLAPDGGACTVIGQERGAPPRDAAMANGVLVHGLDFDDTHQGAIVHPTAACLPSVLAIGEMRDLSGRDILTAYCIGMETAIRIGAAVKGGFHHGGFHATGIVAHFASALAAGRLMGLDVGALVAAQGIAASTASGVQVFLEEGAWTKRLHPGWAAVAAITAASLAARGFRGPSRGYEGRFGLFDTHLHGDCRAELTVMSQGLGDLWMMAETALKPYPVCHFIHGCADAAIALHAQIEGAPIADVEILLPEQTLPIVAEPIEAKRRAATDYEAKFSAPFVVATCLLRGGFGLAHLSPEALAADDVGALALRTSCMADPDSAFPTYFSGGVRVRLQDGRALARHVRVNSGAGDRMLDADTVLRKFEANAVDVLGPDGAARLAETVLSLERGDARTLGARLRAP